MIEYERPGERVGELHPVSPFSLLVNDRNIDDYYSDDDLHVETTAISGRQTTEYDIQTTTPAKFDGQMVLGKRMTAKPIEVVVLIESRDFSRIQAFFSDLNSWLRQTRYINFKDEPDLTYYVEFESGTTPEEAYRQEITLSFLWHNPVKYKSEQEFEYTNSEVLDIDSIEPVEPYIELQFDTGIDTWSMRNTTTDMNINYEYEIVSDRYQVDVDGHHMTRSTDGTNAMPGLELTSDFEDFTIKSGDQIVVTPEPQSISIRYRGVTL